VRDADAVPAEARLVYVCQTFPWLTQTFTVREVRLLREEGVDVHVASFRRPPAELMDATTRELLEVTSFLPAPGTLAAFAPLARAIRSQPRRVGRLLWYALQARGLVQTSLRLRLRSVLAVARGAWIAEHFSSAQLFHAEFADEAATAAMAAAELTDAQFSFKSHSSYNPQQLERKMDRAAFIAVENEFDRNYYFAWAPDARILVNRSGIVVGPAGAEPRAEPGDELCILSVGTLQEKKGHRYLLGALKLLQQRGVPFRCLIVGSGPLERELRAIARELGDRVTIDPYRPHGEVLALYRQYEILALPCVVTDDGDRDGLPNVLIEAAAAGCVLVSSPVSAIPELIEDGVSGLLVPERDEVALADALERLAGDSVLRGRLVAGAERIVRERFDLRRNVAELADRFRGELA
jgi:glycosyltransferase involved in cell wall biosynthesis